MKASLNHLISKPEEGDADYETRKATWKPRPEVEVLIKLLRGNTGVIFSNGDLSKIKTVIDAEAREAPARAGAIAPLDVWIRAGSTGLDPKQTAFFQALNIPTKIVKTQIEI
jgi:large subunit ribosomal protein LP0